MHLPRLQLDRDAAFYANRRTYAAIKAVTIAVLAFCIMSVAAAVTALTILAGYWYMPVLLLVAFFTWSWLTEYRANLRRPMPFFAPRSLRRHDLTTKPNGRISRGSAKALDMWDVH